MALIHLLLLFVCATVHVHATLSPLRLLNYSTEPGRIYVITNINQDPATAHVGFVNYSAPSGLAVEPRLFGVRWVFNMTVAPPLYPVASKGVGEVVTSTPILVGPSGCNNVDPALATITSNCATDGASIELNFQRIRTLAMLPAFGINREECIGQNGDSLTCLGDLHVLRDNVDTFAVARDNPTQLDLLFTRGLVLAGRWGPRGECTTITEIDIEGPKLNVTTNCTWPTDPTRTFSGLYDPFGRDATTAVPELVTWEFAKVDLGGPVQLRVLVTRTDPFSDNFYLQFADAAGAGQTLSYFNIYYQANAYNVSSWPISIAESFSNVLGTTITFSRVGGFANQSCVAVFAINPAPFPPVLKVPLKPTIVDYTYTKQDKRFNQMQVGGYIVGQLDSQGLLVTPYCPAGARCRGYCSLNDPHPPYTPYNVTADVNYRVYQLNCKMWCPKSTRFQDLSGSYVDRDQVARDRCACPIRNTAPIYAADSPTIRSLLCLSQGMSCVTPDCPYCITRMGRAPFCKLGWVLDMEYCYKIFDSATDEQFKVPLNDAPSACNDVDRSFVAGTVTPLTNPTPGQIVFITENLLYQKRTANVAYCASVAGTVSSCFALVRPDPANATSDYTTAYPVGAFTAQYPLCRYFNGKYENKDLWIVNAPETIAQVRNGEANGTRPNGRTAQMRAFDGWGGSVPVMRICDSLAGGLTVFNGGTNPLFNDPQVAFNAKCRSNGHGGCRQMNPAWCECNEYYGPRATTLPSANPDFKDFPCGFPSAAVRGGPFKVMGKIYNDSWSWLVCNGMAGGEGIINPLTNEGYCNCHERFNSNPDIFSFEKAVGGPSCTCRIPNIPPDGYSLNPPNIIQEECSGRGVCCPSPDERCFKDDGTPINRCVCRSGWTGEACTCPTPKNLLDGLVVKTATNLAWVEFQPNYVALVRTQAIPPQYFLGGAAGCTVVKVAIADSVVGKDRIDCVYENLLGDERWLCDPSKGHSFVLVFVSETTPRCRVQAYTTTNGPGGPLGTTNPYAARFFANEYNRAPSFFTELQDPTLAANGCTTTEEMCSTTRSGAQCEAGVSAIQITESGNKVLMCGFDSTPPRGDYVYDRLTGRGSCKCNAISSTDQNGEFNDPSGGTSQKYAGVGCYYSNVTIPERGNVYGLCNLHGYPLAARFDYGFPASDYVDYIHDPLSTPFIRAPGAHLNQFRQQFVDRVVGVWDGDKSLAEPRSVISLWNATTNCTSSWLVAPLTPWTLVGVVGDMGQLCGQTTRESFDATLAIDQVSWQPKRAAANVTIWRLNLTCAEYSYSQPSCFNTTKWTEVCDPSRYTNSTGTGTSACSTTNYCRPEWIAAGSIDPLYQAVPTIKYVAHGNSATVTFPNGLFQLDVGAHTCIASQTWFEVPTPTPFPSGVVRIEPLCARSLSLETDTTTNTRIYGGLDCNNAVHRVVDEKLWQSLGGTVYSPQCFNHTIRPFSYVLGFAYGLFWNQIPDLQFTGDPKYWTVEHYRYLSSILNDQICFDANGAPVVLATEENLDEYLVSLVSRNFEPPYTAQGSAVNVSTPLGFLDFGVQTTSGPILVWDTVANRPSNTLSDRLSWENPYDNYTYQLLSFAAIFEYNALGGGQHLTANGSSFIQSILDTRGATWTQLALQNFGSLHLRGNPGIWQSFNGFATQQLVMVNITFPEDLAVFVVRTADGTVCAYLFNVRAGESRVVDCAAAFAAQNLDPSVVSIGDPREVALPIYSITADLITNQGWIYANVDNVQFAVTLLLFMDFLFEHALDAYGGIRLKSIPQNFYRVYSGQNFSNSFTFGGIHYTFNNLEVDYAILPLVMPSFGYQLADAYDYQFNSSNLIVTLVDNATYAAYWSTLTRQIVVGHRWPYNSILAALQNATVLGGGNCTTIDPTNPVHQKYLLDHFFPFFAARQCTGADVHVKQFSRSSAVQPTCMFGVFQQVNHVLWRQGLAVDEAPVGYGDEGGCSCYASFSRGWWNETVGSGCSLCRAGYGPTYAQLDQFVGYQLGVQKFFPTLNPLYDPSVQPWKGLLAACAVGGDTCVDYFDANVACRYPWNDLTDGGLCSGHGFVGQWNYTVRGNITAWPLGVVPTETVVPACTALKLDGGARFVLGGNPTTPNVLLYVAAGGIDLRTISVIDSVPTLVDPAGGAVTRGVRVGCSRTAFPFTCDYTFGELSCENPGLFDKRGVGSGGGYAAQIEGYEIDPMYTTDWELVLISTTQLREMS